jgi:hypothetical protein
MLLLLSVAPARALGVRGIASRVCREVAFQRSLWREPQLRGLYRQQKRKTRPGRQLAQTLAVPLGAVGGGAGAVALIRSTLHAAERGDTVLPQLIGAVALAALSELLPNSHASGFRHSAEARRQARGQTLDDGRRLNALVLTQAGPQRPLDLRALEDVLR